MRNPEKLQFNMWLSLPFLFMWVIDHFFKGALSGAVIEGILVWSRGNWTRGLSRAGRKSSSLLRSYRRRHCQSGTTYWPPFASIKIYNTFYNKAQLDFKHKRHRGGQIWPGPPDQYNSWPYEGLTESDKNGQTHMAHQTNPPCCQITWIVINIVTFSNMHAIM